MSRADQAREHVFTAELAGEQADAKLEAQLAKEQLARLMGLWGNDLDFYVPDSLPGFPGGVASQRAIERLTLENRVDLEAGRVRLRYIAAEYKLTQATRMISDVEIMAGAEIEIEDGKSDASPVVDLEFQIPIHDTGKLNQRRRELAYMRAANILGQDAVDARSEARSAHKAVTGKYAIARHWRDVVLPLRRTIDEEALLSYNGMLTSIFELLEYARDGLEAELEATEAKRDYWRAEAMVTAVIWGGAAGAGEEGGDE
jgi:outer membrane protein TolC